MTMNQVDPSVRVTSRDVARGFLSVGAIPGDLVIYHGSLSSMGMVDGGPAAVIRGVLDAVGPDGTAAMPTLWYHDLQQRPEEFDVRTSPSYIGALSEAFRTDPRSVRSNDFSHSISAIGARAIELIAGHEACRPLHTPWSNRAFSENSPWDRLYQWNALCCFIGVTMKACTLKHYIEARIVARLLAQAASKERENLRSQLSRLDVPGIWPYYDSEKLAKTLVERGLVRFAKIGNAVLQSIRTRALVNETATLLDRAPQDWFDQTFLNWRRQCLAQ